MILVNLYGAPGAGKSTGAAYVFGVLKMRGINAELVTEYIKEKLWDETSDDFGNQIYTFGKQLVRITRCEKKADVIITDSPLMLSSFYNRDEQYDPEFANLVKKASKTYNSMNYLLVRDCDYNPAGRSQTSEECERIKEMLTDNLNNHKISYTILKGNIDGYQQIANEVLKSLGKE